MIMAPMLSVSLPSARSLAAGAFAGCVATVPMTAVMLALHRWLPARERYRLPPIAVTATLASRLGLRRQTHMKQHEWSPVTVATHFAYGSAAGLLYGGLGSSLHLPPFGFGIVYALVLWAGSYLGLLPALKLHPSATHQPARRRALMIAAHITWGASLDALLALLSHPGKRPPRSR